jgi:hypothetical protein
VNIDWIVDEALINLAKVPPDILKKYSDVVGIRIRNFKEESDQRIHKIDKPNILDDIVDDEGSAITSEQLLPEEESTEKSINDGFISQEIEAAKASMQYVFQQIRPETEAAAVPVQEDVITLATPYQPINLATEESIFEELNTHSSGDFKVRNIQTYQFNYVPIKAFFVLYFTVLYHIVTM